MTRCFTALVSACFAAACGVAGGPLKIVTDEVAAVQFDPAHADYVGIYLAGKGTRYYSLVNAGEVTAGGKAVDFRGFVKWASETPKNQGVRVALSINENSYCPIRVAAFTRFTQPPLEPKTAGAKAPTPDPAASCGKVSVPEGASVASGSGTVVACEGGKSLVLTNRHVCPRLGAGPSFELSGKRYSAFCCCVDDRADLALLLVDAELPACVVAAKCPADGTEVKQYGHPYAGPQKPKQGLIQRFMGWLRDGRPVTHSGIQTEQGDSGCGVFAGNELVAVTWGAGGSCVHLSDVRRLLGVFADKTKAFPKLGAAMRAAAVEAPKAPTPAPIAPTCPGGACPVPPFRPAFRPIMLGGS